MTTRGAIVRVIAGLVAAFWIFNVLAIAAFAIPDRHEGIAVPVMGVLVFAGGMVPVAIFWYLFRGYFQPPRPLVEVLQPAIAAQRAVPELVEPISERETQVLALIADGRSNKEIAQELSVTVGTVKTHTNNINRKLGTNTRTQALARARQLGLI
jgi:DNA-binding CsgD family transcriptional regulator